MVKRSTFIVFDRIMGITWGFSSKVTKLEAVRDVMKDSLGKGYTCREDDFMAVSVMGARA
jgi:hypothetical protein